MTSYFDNAYALLEKASRKDISASSYILNIEKECASSGDYDNLFDIIGAYYPIIFVLKPETLRKITEIPPTKLSPHLGVDNDETVSLQVIALLVLKQRGS